MKLIPKIKPFIPQLIEYQDSMGIIFTFSSLPFQRDIFSTNILIIGDCYLEFCANQMDAFLHL